jgi:hypothetical protein
MLFQPFFLEFLRASCKLQPVNKGVGIAMSKEVPKCHFTFQVASVQKIDHGRHARERFLDLLTAYTGKWLSLRVENQKEIPMGNMPVSPFPGELRTNFCRLNQSVEVSRDFRIIDRLREPQEREILELSLLRRICQSRDVKQDIFPQGVLNDSEEEAGRLVQEVDPLI